MIKSIKIFIVLYFLVFIPKVEGQWIIQFYTDPIASLKQIHFINELVGYSVGYSYITGKSLYKTSNGGTDWILQDKNGAYNCLCFLNADTFFMGSSYGNVSKTTDGGASWIDINLSYPIKTIYFKDKINGWALIDNYGNPFQTTDGGNTWFRSAMMGESETFDNICFADSLNGFGLGWPTLYMKTSDGGLTWQKSKWQYVIFSGIDFISPQVGWIGAYSTIYKTTDGGKSWRSSSVNFPAYSGQVSNLHFFNEDIGAALYSGVYIRTADGGATWNDYYFNNSYGDFSFVSLKKGWAISGNHIYTTENGGTPVELISFTAKQKGNSILLTFETVTELNNRGYEIQRKAGNKDWRTIGFKNGSGTTSEKHSYSFEDNNPPDGKLEYRLKQFDFNGANKIYSTISVDFINDGIQLYQNYPNPFNPVTTISYQLPKAGMVSLKVYDILGNEIVTLVNENKEAGFYNSDFDASKLNSGVYIFQLKASDFVMSKKMISVK